MFVTRFSWFGRLAAHSGDAAFAGYSGVPISAFEIAIVVRAVILLGCVVAWVLRDPPTLSIVESLPWQPGTGDPWGGDREDARRRRRPGARPRPRSTPAGIAPRNRGASGSGLLYCLAVFVSMRLALSLLALVSIALLTNAGALSEGVRNAAQHPRAGERAGLAGARRHARVAQPVDGVGTRGRAVVPAHRDGRLRERRRQRGVLPPVSAPGPRGSRSRWAAIPLAAGILVSNLSLLGALCMLYVLTRTELSEPTARRAVLYAAVFPTSFFFLAPYSESTYLLLVLVCLWAARRERWGAAAAAGAAAALTRNVGLVLALPLAVEAIQRWMESGRRGSRSGGCSPRLGPPAGTARLPRCTGSSAPATGSRRSTSRRAGTGTLTSPLSALWQGSLDALHFTGVYPGGYHQLDLLVVAPALALAGLRGCCASGPRSASSCGPA